MAALEQFRQEFVPPGRHHLVSGGVDGQTTVEGVLGLEVRGDGMRINPVIPADWPGFSMRFRHGETIYALQEENPQGCKRGVSWVEMDGQRLADGVIPLERGW